MKSIAAYLLSAVPAAFAGQLNRTHYGDPNTIFGCLSDEVKAKINGLDGDLCIPPCDSSGKCPQDKPAGVTATPSCVLTSSTGDKYCALTCSSGDLLSPKSLVLDAQCGAKASCKKAQSGGLCTYDDVPKPPSSPHWAPVDSPTFQEQSVCLAVGFTTDGQTGFAGAGSNGVGAQIIKSVDGGKTWAPTPGQNASFNIYLDASAAVSETRAPVATEYLLCVFIRSHIFKITLIHLRAFQSQIRTSH